MSFTSIFWGMFLSAILAYLIYSKRNVKVREERERVYELVRSLCTRDLMEGHDFQWRMEEYESVSFWDMLLPFWVPVESFFQNRKCILPWEEEAVYECYF